jgi:hypothetical protein
MHREKARVQTIVLLTFAAPTAELRVGHVGSQKFVD